jgi:TPR repeat protein
MNAKLFINYRREDTAPYAGRLYDRLIAHFGEDQVFIDIDQIEPGEDFVEVINRKVSACDIAIVAIGPRWLGATDPSGKRRLDDASDFVRMEIVAALQRKIRVIPVLVGGAQMPREQELPEVLAPLSRRNAIELSETRFHADVDRLIEAIKKSFAVAEEKAELSATSVKSNQATPATVPVPSTSSIAALTESKVWTSKRRILVSAIVLFLVALAGFLIWSRHEAQLVDQRNPAILNILGMRFEKGEGVPKNLQKAAELYQKAADQGHADAQCNLGLLYQNGEGVPKDVRKAAELFQKAADQGDARGQFDVSILYYSGDGMPKDVGKAAELFQKAANQGYAPAQSMLGMLYQNGEGVPKDVWKAAELYQKAADQGDAAAQFGLGLLYQNGEGVPKDLEKATELYQKAADQGFEQAIFRLAVLAIESLRNFELEFIDEFVIPGKPYNSIAFETRVDEGKAKFQKAIANDKLPAHRPLLVDLKAQFDADVWHLRWKVSQGMVTPALATEMKKDVNKIYDLALGR